MNRLFIKLLSYTLSSVAVTLAASVNAFHAVEMPASTPSVDELSKPQETAPQRVRILGQADALLNQAREEYRLGAYSNAEESLISALSTVRAGDAGQFISPVTRIRRNSISILGLTLFEFESPSISEPGTGDMKTPESLDNLYSRIINRLALVNESTKTLESLPFQIIIADLAAETYNVDLNQKIDPVVLERQLLARKVPPHAIEDIVEEVRQRQINHYPTEFYRDAHTIELEALRLLQRVLIKQNQPDKVKAALKVAEETRNLESIRSIPAIAYALNNDVLDGRLTDSRIPKLIASKSVSIEDIKRIAEKEKATLVYYSVVAETEIIVWIIQPDGSIHAKSIDFNSMGESLESISRNTLQAAASYVRRGEEDIVLAEALRDLQLRTNAPSRKPPTVPETEQTSQLQRLYQLLISPIEEYLPTGSGSKVIFIPQRELFLVPFAALKAPSGEYLIDRFSIRLSPKLQYILRDDYPLKRFPRGKDILIVGNPTNSQVISLPGAAQEARLLSALTGSYPLIENQATQNNVFQRIEGAKVIHFAAHGILDARPPSGDTILLIHNREKKSPYVQRILSTANSSGQGNQISYSLWPDEDGIGRWHVIRTNGSLPGAVVLSNRDLTSQEILNSRQEKLNIHFDADLVVLSACNTARGIPGESTLLGLPMALGLAGVPQVVVSLWAVPDASTQKLMFEFYSAMREQGSNIDVGDALRKAMLKVKSQKEYRDPIYWAGFTVIDVSR